MKPSAPNTSEMSFRLVGLSSTMSTRLAIRFTRLRLVDRDLNRQPHGKGAAVTFLTRNADGAALKLDDLAGESKPQPRAAEAPRRARIQLLKLHEQLIEIGPVDADAAVAHFQAEHAVLLQGGTHADLAGIGELHRIRQQ